MMEAKSSTRGLLILISALFVTYASGNDDGGNRPVSSTHPFLPHGVTKNQRPLHHERSLLEHGTKHDSRRRKDDEVITKSHTRWQSQYRSLSGEEEHEIFHSQRTVPARDEGKGREESHEMYPRQADDRGESKSDTTVGDPGTPILTTTNKRPPVRLSTLDDSYGPSGECNYSGSEVSFRLELTPDRYADETSWTLADTDGNIIGSSDGFYPPDSFYTYIYSYCVIESQCLVFTIYDYYGDGIIDETIPLFDTGYKLFYNDTLIKNGKGNFGSSEATIVGDKCTTSVPSTLLPSQSLSPSISPSFSLQPSMSPSETCKSADEVLFNLVLTTDWWPSQTSVTIADGVNIWTIDDFTYYFFPHIYNFCFLKSQCLVFTIYDMGHNGILDTYKGGYKLFYDNEMVKEGGNFGSDDTTTFGYGCPTSVPSISVAPSQTVSPSMSPSFSSQPSMSPSETCNSPDEVLFRLVITTDFWPDETFWSLYDENLIATRSTNYIEYEILTTYEYSFCVREEACLTFFINDSGANGIFPIYGSGYKLFYNNTIIKEGGGNFGFAEKTETCKSLSPSISISPSTLPSVLPSYKPTSSGFPTYSPTESLDFITEDNFMRRRFPSQPIRSSDQLSYQSYANCSSSEGSMSSARAGCLSLPTSILSSSPNWAGKLHLHPPTCSTDKRGRNRKCNLNLPMSKPFLPINDNAYPKVKSLISDISSLFSKSTLPTESLYSYSIVTGDINGDGHVDFVTAGDKGSQVYLNRGNGSFSDPTTLSLSDTKAIALCDCNGDGMLDVVTASSQNILYFNDGNGSYESPHYLSSECGVTISALCVDINNSGWLDLIFGCENGPNYLLINNGYGRFGAAITLPGGELLRQNSIVGCDVDQDGYVDLLWISNGTTQYLPNKGDGTFSEVITLPGDGNAVSLALGDIDGDSLLDLVVVGGYSPVQLFLNRNGEFNESMTLPTGIQFGQSVSLADVDGDGNIDIILVCGVQPNLLLINTGDGTFLKSAVLAGNQITTSVAISDVNGDGLVDILMGEARYEDAEVHCLLSRTNIMFSEPMPLPGGNYFSTALQLGHIDKDDNLDIVVLRSNDPGNLLFLNNGDGSFDEGIDLPGNAFYNLIIEIFDANGDGDMDILIDADNGLKVLLNDGDGVFSEEIRIDIDYRIESIALADANQDELVDVIVCCSDESNMIRNILLLSLGNGSYSEPIPLSNHSGLALEISIADINGDKMIDLVFTGNNIVSSYFILNLGNGSFSEEMYLPKGNDKFSTYSGVISLGDVNNDGSVDIIIGRYGSNELLLNSASTELIYNEAITLPDSFDKYNADSYFSTSIILGDVDGDGFLDLFISNYDGPVQLLMNNHGTFNEPISLIDELRVNDMKLGDIDGDGNLDLVLTTDARFSQILFFSPCPNGAKLHAASWCFQCPSFMGRPNDLFPGYRQSICRECLPDSMQDTRTDTCSECLIGEFRNLGDDVCRACPSGTFYNTSVIRSEAKIATSFEEPRCVSCPLGHFSSLSLLAIDSCLPCRPGTFQNRTGSDDCHTCNIGSFQPNRAQSKCEPCTSGGYCDAIDTCDGGFKPCMPGSYNDKVGQSNKDACIACPLGTFSPRTGANSVELCEPCPAGSFTNRIGQTSCQPCQPGTHQPNPGQDSCIDCKEGYYSDNVGLIQCVPCPFRLSSGIGSDTCDICDEGFYLNDANVDGLSIFRQPDDHCFDCPLSASCPRNTTLSTIGITAGYWRDSLDTSILYECETDSTTCKGMNTSDYDEFARGEIFSASFYCSEGHIGPLCSECLDGDKYFNRDKMACINCPRIGEIISRLFIIIVLLFLVTVLILTIMSRFKGVATSLISNLSLQAKIKLTVSFIQVISALRDAEQVQSIYGIDLDDRFKSWFDFLSYFSIDIFAYLNMPLECFGSVKTRLTVSAIWPFIAIGIVFIMQWSVYFVVDWVKRHRKISSMTCFKQSSSASTSTQETSDPAFKLLYWVIFLFYFVLPMVSNSLFVAIYCQAYKTNDYSGEYKSYLIADPNIECNVSDREYSSLLRIFWVWFTIWLVIIPILFVVLLILISKSVRTKRITKLAKASRFLWTDYTEKMMFWDVIDTMKRLFLTGFIILIDPKDGSNKLFRLIIAIIVTVLFLLILASSRPYKRNDDYYLATISNYLIICCLTTGVILHLCDDGDDETCNDIIGINLDSYKASVVVVFLTFAFTLLSIFFLMMIAINTINSPKIKVVKSDEIPNMEIPENCNFHIYMSRLFTSKDKVHSISLKLQQYLPELMISFGSNTMDEHDKKRGNDEIHSSAVFMIFYDIGYFQSKVCQEELLYAMSLNKPIIILYEGNLQVVEYMKNECGMYIPDDPQPPHFLNAMEYAFEEEPIRWLENDDVVFTAATLHITYRRTLGYLPFYKGSDELDMGLKVPGSLDDESTQVKSQLIIRFCESNSGSHYIAEEIRDLIPERKGKNLVDIEPYCANIDVDYDSSDDESSESDLSNSIADSSRMSFLLSLASRTSRRLLMGKKEPDSFHDAPIQEDTSSNTAVLTSKKIEIDHTIPEEESVHDLTSDSSHYTEVFLLYLDAEVLRYRNEQKQMLRKVLKKVMEKKMKIIIAHDDQDDISLSVHWELLADIPYDPNSMDILVESVTFYRSGDYRDVSLRKLLKCMI